MEEKAGERRGVCAQRWGERQGDNTGEGEDTEKDTGGTIDSPEVSSRERPVSVPLETNSRMPLGFRLKAPSEESISLNEVVGLEAVDTACMDV